MALALVGAGCGSSTSTVRSSTDAVVRSTTISSTTTPSAPRRPRPQVVEPVAGQGAGASTSTDPASVTGQGALTANPSLSQPATVTRAPAKGAPTDAQVRAAVAQFKVAVARYHLDKLDLSGDLLNIAQLPPGRYYTSIASFYTDYGLPVACGGVLHVAELGVANKTLPCGTKVIFRYGSRAIEVPVIDRGPYIAGREWDLTGAAAEALKFPGLGPVQWRLAG